MKIAARGYSQSPLKFVFHISFYASLLVFACYLILVLIPALFLVVYPAQLPVYGGLKNILVILIYQPWYEALSALVVMYAWIVSPLWSICLLIWLLFQRRFLITSEKILWTGISVLTLLAVPLTYHISVVFANWLD
jgi:hypothetical protein